MRDGKEVILLVENDRNAIYNEQEFLEEGHYEIVTAENGKKAMEYLEKNPYDTDIMIVALNLPDMDGIELLKQVKQTSCLDGIPVVIIIPVEYKEKQAAAMENDAEDIILSPYEKKVAANRIRNILAAKRHMEYENVMEGFVGKELDKCIDTLGLCKCRQCRKDVVALTLNHLRPRYASTEKGRLLCATDQLSYDYVSAMLRAITESAETVKNNPRHKNGQ